MSGFVELKNVRKIYKMGEVEIKAVDGISFSISPWLSSASAAA